MGRDERMIRRIGMGWALLGLIMLPASAASPPHRGFCAIAIMPCANRSSRSSCCQVVFREGDSNDGTRTVPSTLPHRLGHGQHFRCPHAQYPTWRIVMVYFWAVLHDRPISWATQPCHWPVRAVQNPHRDRALFLSSRRGRRALPRLGNSACVQPRELACAGLTMAGTRASRRLALASCRLADPPEGWARSSSKGPGIHGWQGTTWMGTSGMGLGGPCARQVHCGPGWRTTRARPEHEEPR